MATIKVGDKVKVARDNDNENYDDFRNKKLIVTHAETGGLGYDNAMYPQKLMCFVDEKGNEIPFSLYEYEVEHV